MIDEQSVEAVAPVAQEYEAPVQASEPVQQVYTRPQQDNFQVLRQRAERAEQELQEARRKLQQQSTNLAPDELVEGRHISQVQEEIQGLKNEVKRVQLYAKCPDIDSVLSKENINRFSKEHPEIAQMLQGNPDVFGAAESAYSLIKKLGISTSTQRKAAQEEAIEKNLTKPRSSAALTQESANNALLAINQYGKQTAEERRRTYQQALERARMG